MFLQPDVYILFPVIPLHKRECKQLTEVVGMVQLLECLPNMDIALGSIPYLLRVHTWNSSALGRKQRLED